jgi:hypothetical protein
MRQVKGGAPFALAIQPKLDKFVQKIQARSVAENVAENVYDDLVLKDSYLDDGVRTLFERSRQYDRENGDNITELLFPDLTFSNIIKLSYAEQAKKVRDLIQKLETLDQTHELRTLAETLQQKVNAVNEALEARNKAADTIRRCQVEEELAKNEVRLQYEANYFEARKLLGKRIAESLFSKATTRGTKKNEADTNSDSRNVNSI